MKQLAYSTAATLACLLLAVFVAHRVLVAPLSADISGEKAILASLQEEQGQLEEDVKRLSEKMKDQLKIGPPGRVMNPGEESLLLGGVLAVASATDVVVQGFELHPPFRAKGEAGSQNAAARAAPMQPAELPQLDENGMPVGAETDEGNEEWPGVEVLPVSLKLKATYPSFGRFFDLLKKKLPLWGVQTMNLDLDGSGIVRGDLRLTFPTLGSHDAGATRRANSGR